VHSDPTDTVLRNPDESQPDSAGRRFVRFLMRRPAGLSSPIARWAVNVLALGGAAMLVWSSVIHLELWGDGYKDISVVGPLFLIQGIFAIVLALAMVVLRWLMLLAAGAVTLAATAVALLLSVHIALFGFKESMAVPYANLSLGVEWGGAAALAVAAAILLFVRPRVQAKPEPVSARS
jgi:hypothetical protein